MHAVVVMLMLVHTVRVPLPLMHPVAVVLVV